MSENRETTPQKKRKIILGGFELIKKIGEGGMGTVYKAHQISMKRDVALKVLLKRFSANEEFIGRFYREAHAAAKLNHPNVVTAFDVGEDKKYHYFAMELINGMPLQNLIEKTDGPLSEDYSLYIIRQVVVGLAHAAKNNIIHRDIKPDNILLTHDGDADSYTFGDFEDIAKIVDLGIAKLIDDNQSMLTQEGTAMGTPHYISPEQAQGETDIDFRSDIYSLGATLYHMVTGETPFSGTTPIQVVLAHVQKNITNPQKINPNISDEGVALIKRMMQKKKKDRYKNYDELLDDIDTVIEFHEEYEVALASRASRFCAHLLDLSLFFLIFLPLGVLIFIGIGVDESGVIRYILQPFIALLSFSILNIYFLRKNGQTLGKKTFDIKIVRDDNGKVKLRDLLFKRYFPFYILLSLIMIASFFTSLFFSTILLINYLLIFNSKRKCLHDIIAKTKVIKV